MRSPGSDPGLFSLRTAAWVEQSDTHHRRAQTAFRFSAAQPTVGRFSEANAAYRETTDRAAPCDYGIATRVAWDQLTREVSSLQSEHRAMLPTRKCTMKSAGREQNGFLKSLSDHDFEYRI
jgi:hypothetical protein